MPPSSEQRARVGMALPRVHEPFGIECSLQRMELVEFFVVELHAHGVQFFDTHAVLPGHGAAGLHAQPQDPIAKLLGLFQLTRQIGVEQDQRVQVAVAGVEHVGNAQAEFLGQPADPVQNLGELGPGNRAVHAVVVRRQSAHGRKRCLAPLPEAFLVGGILRHADIGTVGLKDRLHAVRVGVHFVRGPV